MNIADVMDDLATAVDTIDGLRVFPYAADRITPPAAVVGWPDSYTFDTTYGRGSDRAVFPVTVLAGRVDARSARDRLAKYADGSGPSSVKAAVDGHDSAAWDSVRVQAPDFEVITVAGVEYLAAVFTVDVFGKGSS